MVSKVEPVRKLGLYGVKGRVSQRAASKEHLNCLFLFYNVEMT